MQALRLGSAEQLQRGPARPWQLGWQMNERNLVWSDDLKLRLIKVGGPQAACVRCVLCPRVEVLPAVPHRCRRSPVRCQ